MTRRSNAALRCGRCRLHQSLCVCALIPRLETKSRVVLFMHRNEDRKPTNTGRLAAECLVNSEIRLRGSETEGSEPSVTEPFVTEPGSLALLLFPYADAVPLERFANTSERLVLVVPDGTWRQAFKVRNRVPGLGELACVSLPEGEPSRYRLRFEAQKGGLATMEAIARALGLLEGVAVQRAMEQVFRVAVDRMLWSRGVLDGREVSGGIPAGVVRHDPGGAGGQRRGHGPSFAPRH